MAPRFQLSGWVGPQSLFAPCRKGGKSIDRISRSLTPELIIPELNIRVRSNEKMTSLKGSFSCMRHTIVNSERVQGHEVRKVQPNNRAAGQESGSL